MRAALIICIALLLGALPARAAGFIRDAEIERLLYDYTAPLLRAAGLSPEQTGIYVIDDPNINAFVANGQNIYFHTGLILESDRPNIVIGVAAHEIGHITGGHLSRTASAASRSGAPAVIATILGLGSILAGAGDVGIALIAGGMQVAQSGFLSYSRAQEASADQTALQLLQATKQSPRGITDLMERLAVQEVLSEQRRDPYVRSHPLSRNRVNAYQSGAQSSPYWQAKDAPSLQFRHDMAKAKIRGFLDDPRITLRRFPSSDRSLPARYARAIALYQASRIDDAIMAVDTLIGELPDNPYLHELKGQIHYESGRAEAAIAPFERALALQPDEPLFLIGLALAQSTLGQQQINGTARFKSNMTARAIKNFKQSLRLDPKNAASFFRLSSAYGQIGDTGRAEWALAEYHALRGAKQARIHARRALKLLPRNAIEYLRAADIAAAP